MKARLAALAALTLIITGCGVQGQTVTGKWIDGPDGVGKVWCVGGDSSLSCNWGAYNKSQGAR